MKVLICGSPDSLQEIKESIPPENRDIVFAAQWDDVPDKDHYDAFFILDRGGLDLKKVIKGKPVFINEATTTLKEIDAPGNVIRINGWPGFLKRDIWEAAGDISAKAQEAAAVLGKKLIAVKDVPGLVAATVVSMIVNEAFQALNEGLSTQEDIDLAMKAGTNYPYGPFEWAERIGLKNIYELLQKLSVDDARYTPLFQTAKVS